MPDRSALDELMRVLLSSSPRAAEAFARGVISVHITDDRDEQKRIIDGTEPIPSLVARARRHMEDDIRANGKYAHDERYAKFMHGLWRDLINGGLLWDAAFDDSRYFKDGVYANGAAALGVTPAASPEPPPTEQKPNAPTIKSKNIGGFIRYSFTADSSHSFTADVSAHFSGVPPYELPGDGAWNIDAQPDRTRWSLQNLTVKRVEYVIDEVRKDTSEQAIKLYGLLHDWMGRKQNGKHIPGMLEAELQLRIKAWFAEHQGKREVDADAEAAVVPADLSPEEALLIWWQQKQQLVIETAANHPRRQAKMAAQVVLDNFQRRIKGSAEQVSTTELENSIRAFDDAIYQGEGHPRGGVELVYRQHEGEIERYAEEGDPISMVLKARAYLAHKYPTRPGAEAAFRRALSLWMIRWEMDSSYGRYLPDIFPVAIAKYEAEIDRRATKDKDRASIDLQAAIAETNRVGYLPARQWFRLWALIWFEMHHPAAITADLQ